MISRLGNFVRPNQSSKKSLWWTVSEGAVASDDVTACGRGQAHECGQSSHRKSLTENVENGEASLIRLDRCPGIPRFLYLPDGATDLPKTDCSVSPCRSSSKSSQVNGRNLITLPQKKRAARRRQLKYTGISGG